MTLHHQLRAAVLLENRAAATGSLHCIMQWLLCRDLEQQTGQHRLPFHHTVRSAGLGQEPLPSTQPAFLSNQGCVAV